MRMAILSSSHAPEGTVHDRLCKTTEVLEIHLRADREFTGHQNEQGSHRFPDQGEIRSRRWTVLDQSSLPKAQVLWGTATAENSDGQHEGLLEMRSSQRETKTPSKTISQRRRSTSLGVVSKAEAPPLEESTWRLYRVRSDALYMDPFHDRFNLQKASGRNTDPATSAPATV